MKHRIRWKALLAHGLTRVPHCRRTWRGFTFSPWGREPRHVWLFGPELQLWTGRLFLLVRCVLPSTETDSVVGRSVPKGSVPWW